MATERFYHASLPKEPYEGDPNSPDSKMEFSVWVSSAFGGYSAFLRTKDSSGKEIALRLDSSSLDELINALQKASSAVDQ